MSHILEVLGRGLLSSLSGAFQAALRDTEPEATVQELRARARQDTSDAAPWVLLGGRFLRQMRAVEARDCFARAVKLDDESGEARIGLACAVDELGRTDEAIAQLRDVQRMHPDDVAVCFCLAFCLERREQASLAAAEYRRSLQLCPTLRNAHERLAAISLQRGQIDRSIDHYRQLCDLDPDQIELHLMLGNLLLHAGEADEAVKQCEIALTMQPDNWSGRNDSAAAYESAGLLTEAIERLEETSQTDPDSADTYLRLGDLYRKVGRSRRALDRYLRAVQVNPDYLEATVKVGTMELHEQHYLEAAQWFNRAVQLNDRLLACYVSLAVAQHACGQIEPSAESLEMARSLEPNSTLLFSEVAGLQLKASMSPPTGRSAIAAGLDQARRRDAHDAAVLLDEQIRRHQHAVQRSENHAELRYRLGVLLRQKECFDEAIGQYRQAVAINPVYARANIKLGLALQERGVEQEAMETLQQSVRVGPEDMTLHYKLGLLFSQRAQFELAVEHFEHKTTENGQHLAVHGNLVLALQNMGLVDGAAATWQAISELNAAHTGQTVSSSQAGLTD